MVEFFFCWPQIASIGMKLFVLASGSSGNACYLETDRVRVLVDAGLSCREIERRLEQVGIPPESLDALIITHEHSDHVKGAGPLARRFDLSVYTNQKTLQRGLGTIGILPRAVIVDTGQTLTIDDLSVETFTKCHDAADPFGLVLSCNGVKVGLVTDLGRSTRLVEDHLKQCQALIMEFNYDLAMLEEGPYPLDLKRRIKGADGHLSNQQAGDLLRVVSHEGLKFVILAHLSETNNHPIKAHQEAASVLSECGLPATRVLVARPHEPGPMVELEVKV
jgi:phosphoribosyl 1,2-cyclic phosphodiesterase